MLGSEDTIARDGIHLIVSTPGGQSDEWERTLHQLILSNEEETRITKSIECESETADEGRSASANMPYELLRHLRNSFQAETFMAGKTYPVFITTKVAPASRISFTTKPDPRRRIYIFKDQSVRGIVSTIDVEFQLADETTAVARAFRTYNVRQKETDEVMLCVSIYLRQLEFDRLFRDCYIISEKPDLRIVIGLICYQWRLELLCAEPWDDQTILIEEGVTVSVDLRSVSSGRLFKSVAPQANEAELETVVADESEAGTEDRFERALARLETSHYKLATSLRRFLLAFVLIIGLLLLTRGHFF
jgi:hypothetical protein